MEINIKSLNIKHYIYALCNPDTKIPSYIGKTKNLVKRYIAHLGIELKTKSKKTFWIKSLLKKNKTPLMLILDIGTTDDIDKKEIDYIAFWREKNPKLKNMTEGGTGGTTHHGKPVKIKCSNGKVYSSIKAAAEELGINRMSISHVLKGTAISASGYRFCLPDETFSTRQKENNTIPINCSNGKRYESIVQAANELGIEGSNISYCAKGKRNTAGGLSFWYDNSSFKKRISGKAVLCLTNGKIYNNARLAAADLNVSYKTISNYLTGHRKTAKGYTFRFIKETVKNE